ncbi:MAG: hypothetical protein ACOYWZ_01005 [Bacillota bacterium]
MDNMYDHAVPIPLPVHQDPQCYVLARYIRDEIWAYFRIWNNEFKEDTEHIGCLHFSGIWAVKTERFTKCKF